MPVKRHFALLLVGMATLLLQGAAEAATLEQLSLADMIAQSTGIVRAKVGDSYAAAAGPVIYTHYRLQVSERYKGPAQSTVDLALPGGIAHGIQQVYSGVPRLHAGEEYVFFLWTGKSGLTQVIGLTQGLFAISNAGAANPSVTRAATHEGMVDRNGRRVQDRPIGMTLAGLKSQIAAAQGGR